jgi:hypothetical protein
VAVIKVEVGIYVHVHVQRERMSTIAPMLVIRIVAGDDVRIVTVVAGGGIVILTRNPN